MTDLYNHNITLTMEKLRPMVMNSRKNNLFLIEHGIEITATWLCI